MITKKITLMNLAEFVLKKDLIFNEQIIELKKNGWNCI